MNNQNLTEDLLAWFAQNRRDLPWRENAPQPGPLRDPYRVWISEIMLQQTQVATVITYFENWMEQFPTVEDLADADRDEVLGAWEGLGYYRRARMLHEAAGEMKEMPTSFDAWLDIKGVGEYTAAAIASIAFGECVAAVDGNVTRVISRLFAIDENVDTAVGKRAVRTNAQNLVSEEDPGGTNEAFMELGATVCTPKTPNCEQCPVHSFCEGTDDPTRFPIKNPRRRAKKWAPWVVIPLRDGQIGLRRGDKELLGDLWGFETFESKQALVSSWPAGNELGTVRHLFTHRDTTFHVVLHHASEGDYNWVDPQQPDLPPMTTAMKKVLNLYLSQT